MMVQIATGSIAAIACLSILIAGRHDLTRPWVAFGVPWFLAIALAQLDLTGFGEAWDAGFALLALGGGLTFVVAVLLAAGTRGARGAKRLPDRAAYDHRRLLGLALLLLAGAGVGLYLQSRIVGGVALFSENIEEVRARAYGEYDVAVPSHVTFLVDGFYLGAWALLAFAWMRWRDLRTPARIAVLILLVVGAVGALSGGSRNVLMFAVAVPLIAAYAATTRLSRRARATSAATVACLLLAFSAFYLVRSSSAAGSDVYLTAELESQPAVLRPVVPVYVAATYPLEAERRLVEAMPDRFTPTGGSATLASFPDALFPERKTAYGPQLGALTNTGETTPYWTVASYQGRILSDFGAGAVLPFSLLLGLGFGLAYRASRGRRGFLPLVAVAVAAYYAAFMTYDNLLSFSLVAFYDLLMVAGVELACRRQGTRTETVVG